MLVIFGITRTQRLLFARPGSCPRCRVAGPHQVLEQASRLTFFFIPVLTTRRHYFSECLNCGCRTELSRQQKDLLAAR
ncbi:zinc-ribbon domain-containing protein [Arthrobacter sp. I2-34]|uniref:Zinc-ribbon domain-containing protein n=1 Tax=Arthrobacter hankyongi TaxID=2904801 RepID=A0ABS9L2D2_9MICC|nr:zinc-ribbon domain-containing protein [Arthrobacter hankyongi]MCG2620835.1 zinc-ribbon domain-containing protein [Arthrobacter hankyongi]